MGKVILTVELNHDAINQLINNAKSSGVIPTKKGVENCKIFNIIKH